MEELAIKINELMGNKSKIKFLDLGEEESEILALKSLEEYLQ